MIIVKRVCGLLLFLAILSGCYTQLLTSAHYASTSSASDSSGINQAENYSNSTPLNNCNCTPFEIQHDLCWCECDRCGLYHRLGYQYCPRGIYSSFGYWDYYNDYPWWQQTYWRNRYPDRQYYNNGSPYYSPSRHYSGGSGSKGGGSTSTVPTVDNLPKLNNQTDVRNLLNPKKESLPPPKASTSPEALPEKKSANPDSSKSLKTDFDNIRNMKRVR